MAEVLKDDKNKFGDEEYAMLEEDELFFPRNEKEEIIPKKTFVEEKIPEKKLVKEKVKDKDGNILKDKDGKDKEKLVEKTIFKSIKRGIIITPMPRGEWIEMLNIGKDGETTDDQDALILENHLIKPKTTAEKLKKSGKHFLISKIVQKILEFSSLVLVDDKKKESKDQ